MEFDLVLRVGVRVIEDPDLDVDVCYVDERRLAIIRAGMDSATRTWCADWVLSEVLSLRSTTTL